MALSGYVPKGFSPEGWAFKAKEDREHDKKKKHFKSRSLVDYQKDLEAGKGKDFMQYYKICQFVHVH